jgi:hypothetical protein
MPQATHRLRRDFDNDAFERVLFIPPGSSRDAVERVPADDGGAVERGVIRLAK